VAIAQSLLDDLWDFSDPAGSEVRLRAAAQESTDAASRAEFQTQVARALGLQERYDEADAILDAIRADSPVIVVRVALERGRLRNSSGDPAAAPATSPRAITEFELARDAAVRWGTPQQIVWADEALAEARAAAPGR
jgi:hypothetical protein